MCGICGVIGSGSGIPVEKMARKMAHRGPDDIGVWNNGHAHLGHTRLAIIDTSSAGHQPMPNEDNTIWVTFNGTIYNFQPLRSELERKGHKFRSKTDTEVVIHLYEEFRERCLEHMRGMFAFALWDIKEERLFAARDRVGVKPFFYSYESGKFIFASELRAMLASGIAPSGMNTDAVKSYFNYGAIPAPHTIINGIRQLLPAHYLVLEDSKVTITKYWSPDIFSVSGREEEEARVVRVRRALEDAVRVRMVSDVPIGVFLSGGIDSSAVAALMQKNSPHPVHTFSVVFEEEGYDEREFSKKVARRLCTNHRQILLGAEDILNAMPEIFGAMDQPSIDGFNTFMVSRAAKEAGFKVALSGLGGDELFAGYRSFRILPGLAKIAKAASCLPEDFRRYLSDRLRPMARTRKNLKFVSSVLRCGDLEDLYFLQRSVFFDEEAGRLLTVDARPGQPHRGPDRQCAGLDAINRLSMLELTNYTQDMLLKDTDCMSMANSIEVRVPFLDHILVEEMLRVPGPVKTAGRIPKALLAKAIGDLLPEEIYRRPKAGFVFPFEDWLKGPFKGICEEKFSSANLKNIPILDHEQVNAVWRSFLAGEKIYGYSHVLCLLSFINWHERHIG